MNIRKNWWRTCDLAKRTNTRMEYTKIYEILIILLNFIWTPYKSWYFTPYSTDRFSFLFIFQFPFMWQLLRLLCISFKLIKKITFLKSIREVYSSHLSAFIDHDKPILILLLFLPKNCELRCICSNSIQQ